MVVHLLLRAYHRRICTENRFVDRIRRLVSGCRILSFSLDSVHMPARLSCAVSVGRLQSPLRDPCSGPSNLIEYKVSTNNNGKMSQEVYVNQILEKEVVNWCKQPSRWVLEEDGNSGHSNQSKDNLVTK